MRGRIPWRSPHAITVMASPPGSSNGALRTGLKRLLRRFWIAAFGRSAQPTMSVTLPYARRRLGDADHSETGRWSLRAIV